MQAYQQGRYADAEALFKAVLEIDQKSLGPEHPKVGNSLNNIAEVYSALGRYASTGMP
jgi:tetratricopeptide (TPR) repeat protein